jgi:predicted MFS family arabinose efflux permease
VGGLVFGARTSRRELLETYLFIGLLFPLACLPMIAASSPLAMAFLVLLAGAPIAPLIATRNELIAAVAPPGTGTESFTWLMTSLIAGLSLGTAVGGAVIEASGWPATVLVGTTVAAAGAVVAFAGRGVLRPALAPA